MNPDTTQWQIKTFRVLLTGFGPYNSHRVNPSWLAVKALHNVTITSDQWQEIFGNIVAATPKALSPTTAGSSPSKRLIDASSSIPPVGSSPSSLASTSKAAPVSGSKSPPATPTAVPIVVLPPLPEPGPYNIHITAIEIPMLYEGVLSVIPGLHLKPPQLPTPPRSSSSDDADNEPFPAPPEHGYDFIFHVGAAGRGSLRMEIIGHKYGYNMKDASGVYCAVVPPPSATKNLNNNRGPGTAPPPAPTGPLIQAGPYAAGGGGPAGIHGSGFGSMGMGYNNERLGYNPAVHDPQPGIAGSENVVRPMRGFGTAYETFPDEMATDIDVTRLVQDLKASGMSAIYTSMDAGHYLCDFIYYCSLAESKRSSKALLPFLTSTPYIAPSPHYGPTYGPQAYQMQPFPGSSSNAHTTDANTNNTNSSSSSGGSSGSGAHPPGPPHPYGLNVHALNKPARVLLMHCPPVNEPLSTEEVTETIKRIVIWVGREMEIMDMREKAAHELPDESGAPPPVAAAAAAFN